jgi:two-component system response regulator YesN
MGKARELIATGNYKIAEVSSIMGYQSANKFTSAFKQVIGVLPSEIIRSK